MSIKQMTLVFNDESIKGNEKLLMIAIADNCNDSGVAFPSWGELMRKTSMSKGSISKWMKELEDKKLLFRKARNRQNGSRTSNKFLIYPYKNQDILDEEDMLIFKDLFIQSSEVEPLTKVQELNTPCSEVELPRGGQSSGVEHLEPSLTINRQSTHHLCVEIINHLNDVLNKNYKLTTSSTKKLIEYKLKQGFTIEDFQKVHITKYSEWNGTDMQKYLRPETLYGTKFESYLNQKLTSNEKYRAISEHTGMSALEMLKREGRA